MMMGRDKKKLLQVLPEKVAIVLQPDTATKVVEVWKEFRTPYYAISQPDINQKNALAIFDFSRSFLVCLIR